MPHDKVHRGLAVRLAQGSWTRSTGPKTAEGKARSARNCKTQQKGPFSVRQLRAELTDLRALALDMQEGRQLAGQ